MKVKQDKVISLLILSISVFLIILWIYGIYVNSASEIGLSKFSLKSMVYWANYNTDLIIIIYVFLSLQLAGISEFKQGQDYLIVAFISLVFTPIGLLFIKNEKNDKTE
tara:strand:- start:90 stop:413 length:324 start_codon:yes stop_codon:yes gene_type:complete